MKNNNIEKTEFLKIVYFDEAAAQDYVDVTNGGRLDWSTQENKEKIAKIVAEIEAQAKSGFNILNYIKATFQGKVDASASAELTSAFDKTIKNTLLTDYIQAASKDEHVKKFENSGVYAPENSVTLYKMLSSYLTIVPKEEIPIDMEKLNEAILGERGYYDMLLKTEKERKSILRFNLQAFKNNYNLVDLSKMKLTYFGIKVGTCGENHLSIDKEFDLILLLKKLFRKVQEILVKWQRNLMMVIKKWMCLLTFQGSQNQSLRKRRNRECKILLFMQMSTVVFRNM